MWGGGACREDERDGGREREGVGVRPPLRLCIFPLSLPAPLPLPLPIFHISHIISESLSESPSESLSESLNRSLPYPPPQLPLPSSPVPFQLGPCLPLQSLPPATLSHARRPPVQERDAQHRASAAAREAREARQQGRADKFEGYRCDPSHYPSHYPSRCPSHTRVTIRVIIRVTPPKQGGRFEGYGCGPATIGERTRISDSD